MNIVIVEDQRDLSELLSERLKVAGFKTDVAFDGEQALDLISSDLHDLVILDRGLPDMEGLDVLKALREHKIQIPVLILTAKDGLGDRIEGLNGGADDYLIKPFEIDELIARIHALLRRPSEAIDVVIRFGNITFKPSENSLRVNGKRADVSVKEKDALERLIRLPNKVVSKDALQTSIYGYGAEGSHNSVEVIVHRLRKKLEEANSNIEIKTLRGIGYMMKEK